MNSRKITTSHGHKRWVIDITLAGKRTRAYYNSNGEAEAAYRKSAQEVKKYGDLFARLKESDRIELGIAHELAGGHGFRVSDAVEHYRRELDKSAAIAALTLEDAVENCLTDKEDGGYRKRSLDSLRSTLTRFKASIGGTTRVGDASRAAAKGWIMRGRTPSGEPWSSRTRNNYLTDLRTFFSWLVDEGVLTSSPVGKIKKWKQSEAEESAAASKRSKILDYGEVIQVIGAVLKYEPDIMAHVALGLWAGLRPERELERIGWDDIMLDERLIHVSKRNAKDRQNRYIPMSPNLYEWLRWAKKEKLPLPRTDMNSHFENARKQVGLWKDNWPHDGVRHTFASNHLAVYGADATIEALGHGDYDMLFKNYRTLVKRAGGEKHFNILPTTFPCIGMYSDV